MMVQALENFQQEHDVCLEKITRIPLEGEGTIERRVERGVSVYWILCPCRLTYFTGQIIHQIVGESGVDP